ncbi:MAG: Obg family GTPase CgtA, partial [Eubacteriales bacterium]|nr:Obg family GTPase CgtA [Eubacteriales bacterium]
THLEQFGYPLFALSAALHTGTRDLTLKIAEKLSTLPPVIVYEPEYVKRMPVVDASEPLDITVDDNTYIVEGKWLQRLMSNINFSDYESRMYFDKTLRDNGVFTQLEAMGIQDGDIVSMYNLEFEYQH